MPKIPENFNEWRKKKQLPKKSSTTNGSRFLPRSKLWCGDCLRVLPTLPPNSVDLVFADPPFNTGYKYDQYDDQLDDAKYLMWTVFWLRRCYSVMKSNASIYVATGLKYQAEVKQAMSALGLHWRTTICWHFTFGSAQQGNWTPSWVAIHYFTKSDKEYTWNPEEVRVPSARQLKYRDRRANPTGKVPDNTWVSPDCGTSTRPSRTLASSTELPAKSSREVILPGMPDYEQAFSSSSDCWLESRVCGTFKERTPHPCQMNVKILERIILASSNEGDLVLDPFLGSGTTAVAASTLKRRYWGIELSEDYLNIARARLEVPF
jgi:site-specific DNA-methyltransferase (adenine-specific)